MSRPRLLDLFCGAGGAAVGYHRAGFDVVGVDNRPQPDYPFAFAQADAFDYLATVPLGWFDAIHASPPCKAHTKTGWAYRYGHRAKHADLLTPCRELLNATGLPWVIENVPGSPMRPDVVLCGSQFGLNVRRHRWFEFAEVPPLELVAPCVHPRRVVTPLGNANAARGLRREWNAALGIDWMTTAAELSQAIPPAYTEWIGARLLAALEEEGKMRTTTAEWRCGQLAPRDTWQAVYAAPRPVRCNRAPGHEGAHRYTRPENFSVLAEWSDAEVPSA